MSDLPDLKPLIILFSSASIFFIYKLCMTFVVKYYWTKKYADILSSEIKVIGAGRNRRKICIIKLTYEIDRQAYTRNTNLTYFPFRTMPSSGTKEVIFVNPENPEIFRLDYSVNHVMQKIYLGLIGVFLYGLMIMILFIIIL